MDTAAVIVASTAEAFGLPYQAIGRLFGGRNHATVMYAVRKVDQQLVQHRSGARPCPAAAVAFQLIHDLPVP